MKSVYIANADSPTGYGIASELLSGKYEDQFDLIICTVKDVDYSGNLSSRGACIIEMRDEHPPQWLGGFLKKQKVDAFVLVPDVASGRMMQQAKNLLDMCKESGIREGAFISVVGSDDRTVETAKRMKELENESIKNNLCVVQTTMIEQWLYLVAMEIRNLKVALPIKPDARCALLDQNDLFQFVAHGLSSSRNLGHINLQKGKTYILTGPQSHSINELIDILNKVLNEKILYDQIDRNQMKEHLKKLTMHDMKMEFILDVFDLINNGKQNLVSHDEKKHTGKEAKSFEAWVRANSKRFQRK